MPADVDASIDPRLPCGDVVADRAIDRGARRAPRRRSRATGQCVSVAGSTGSRRQPASARIGSTASASARASASVTSSCRGSSSRRWSRRDREVRRLDEIAAGARRGRQPAGREPQLGDVDVLDGDAGPRREHERLPARQRRVDRERRRLGVAGLRDEARRFGSDGPPEQLRRERRIDERGEDEEVEVGHEPRFYRRRRAERTAQRTCVADRAASGVPDACGKLPAPVVLRARDAIGTPRDAVASIDGATPAPRAPQRPPVPVNLPYEWQVGLRYTRAGKRRGEVDSSGKAGDGFVSFIAAISMAGIALGVAALIVVLSVMNGFQKEVRDRMLSVLAHVEVFNPETGVKRLEVARGRGRAAAGGPRGRAVRAGPGDADARRRRPRRADPRRRAGRRGEGLGPRVRDACRQAVGPRARQLQHRARQRARARVRRARRRPHQRARAAGRRHAGRRRSRG